MAGIYIHIPFCRKACHYCNFHFSTSLKTKNDFIQALLKEIVLQRNWIGGEEINTIYFGGGTPSLLSGWELTHILDALTKNFIVHPAAEVTLETNPDDFHQLLVQEWLKAGFNRLSIGVQSFFEDDLRWMNRAHTASQAISSIKMAQETGFTNLTIDLIYGTPGMTDERWKENVNTAFEVNIPHLSCYALTIETGTALYQQIKNKQLRDVSSDDQARQFQLLMNWMKDAGYEHYEISNFAKPGFRSRHNTSYWEGTSYLGLGPSAHSFNGRERKWNVSNNALYISSIQMGEIPYQQELLTPDQRLNEYIMTSLRRKEGISLEYVVENYNGAADRIRTCSKKFIEQGNMIETSGFLTLTDNGKLFADGIASELFFF